MLNVIHAHCHLVECHSAECRSTIFMSSVINLSVVELNVVAPLDIVLPTPDVATLEQLRNFSLKHSKPVYLD